MENGVAHAAGVISWEVMVLLSWLGFGLAACRVADKRPAHPGLAAAVGLAVVALIGGILNAGRLCSPLTLGALTLVGVALAVPRLLHAGRRLLRRRPGLIRRRLPLLIVGGYGAFVLVAASASQQFGVNYIDDMPLYMHLPVRMLQTGAAIDPLNGRRLSTFGGYAFLQAQLGVVGDHRQAFATDAGLAAVVLVGLLAGWLPRRRTVRWALVPLAVVVWLYPLPRDNSMVMWGTTAALLAMFRCVQWADRRPGRRLAWLGLAAACATAACSFRDNTMALPPLFFVLYFADRLWRGRRPWREVLAETAFVAGVGAVTLLPWSLALYQSSGSLIYPLMRGNHRDPGYAFNPPGVSTFSLLIEGLTPLAQKSFWLASLPVVFLAIRREWKALYLFAAAIGMTVLTGASFSLAAPNWIVRFCLPAVLAAGLYSLARLARRPPARPWVWAVAALVLFVAVVVWPGQSPWAQFRGQVLAVPYLIDEGDLALYPPGLQLRYAAAQQVVPPGATLATAVQAPALLDARRNRIYCLDVPGGASLVGLWPFGKGPEALHRFLIDQGVDYVMYADFDHERGFYDPHWWLPRADAGDMGGKRLLNMMATLQQLGRSRPLLYDAYGLRVLRLR